MSKIDRSREGTMLAPALYGPEAVRVHADGSVSIIGAPLRGRVTLMSCYTPAWWYATCRECHWLDGRLDDEYDPRLVEMARDHRCGR